MFIKRLELQGFKSFAHRVEIEFGPGITVIVGPNGCGKSNITEAIKWVLGEQNARALRGFKMDDVIFAGAVRHRPVGMAEVSLTVENSSRLLPLAYEEINVTRRVYRSGESEYFINKKPCRLRDVQELFGSCGISRAVFSITSQGKIEELLSLRPEERRVFLEEVAGVSRYRQRKAEALCKLEETDHELIRLCDILAELERQVVPLKEQAEIAKYFKAYKASLKELELALLEHELIKHQERKECFLKECEKTKNLLKKEQQVASYLENEIKFAREGLDERKKVISKFERDYELIQKQIQDLNFSKIRVEEKKSFYNTQMAELISRIDSYRQRYRALKKELSEIEEKHPDVQKLKDKVELNFRELEDKLRSIEKKKVRIQSEWEANNVELFEVVRKKTALISQIRELKGKKDIFLRQDASVTKKTEEANLRILDLKKKIQEQKQVLEAQKQFEKKILFEIKQYEEKFQDYKKQKEEFVALYQECLKNIEGKKMYLRILKDANEKKEGYQKGVKEILNVINQSPPLFTGILGLVEDLFNMDTEIERAIMTALGRAAHYFVCTTADVAYQAISYLKARGCGRASFLPIEAIDIWAKKERVLDYELTSGIIGRAAELVVCDKMFQNIAEYLLGRTFVAESFNSARDFAEKYYYKVRVVTLDGELIQPGGLITGGKESFYTASTRKRQLEINQIETEIQKFKHEAEKLKRSNNSLNLEMDFIESKLMELSKLKRDNEFQKSELEKIIAGLEQELKQLTDFVHIYLLDKKEHSYQRESLDKEIFQLEQNLPVLLNCEKSLEEKRNILEQERKACEDEIQNFNEQISNLRVSLTSLNEQLKHMLDKKHVLEGMLSQQESGLKKLQASLKEVSLKIKDLNTNEQKLCKQIDIFEKKSLVLLQALEFKRKQMKSKNAYFNAKEKRYFKLKQIISRRQQFLNDLKLQLMQIDEQIEQIRFRFCEYGGAFISEKNSRKLDSKQEIEIKKKIDECKKKLSEMGEVNFAAPAEFQVLQERINYLLQQKKDLEEGKESLIKIIKEMDRVVVNKFIETYQLIKKNFEEIFLSLCEGGKAELFLTDEKNPLNSGLDVFVVPRGKKLRHLSLLSGGERALTGIAFLFALLKSCPLPFYLLDEVDAYLDESNVGRFASFLRMLSKNSQIIVVSHRFQTMQAADILYGVTMEEPGISTLVPLKLDEFKYLESKAQGNSLE